MTLRARALFVLPTLAVAGLAAACTSNATDKADGAGGADRSRISVSSTAKACELSASSAPAGNLVFSVKNDGSKVTEFYLLAKDGSILGEVENIGPGITRKLVVTVQPGRYTGRCKPGMTGAGITAPFQVTGKATSTSASGTKARLLDQATARYQDYVTTESTQLLAKTKAFAAQYVAGDDDAARSAYAPARVHWERIEPVAESFGDLDPRLDLREADLEDGQAWTGWHRIEKDLWPADAAGYAPATTAERKALAEQLVADTTELDGRVQELTYTPAQIGNGAKELLDEVATGKITGEEEIWSHTDLWDFQANVDGAHEAFESLEPIVKLEDADLVRTLDERFAAVQALLDAQKRGDGFVRYDQLTKAEIKAMADAVDALSEPLSKLTAAAVL